MKLKSIICSALALSILHVGTGWAQESVESTPNEPNSWFLQDPSADNVQGMSVEKTYTTLLKGRASKTVLVAVIDSGIDIDHEDLKSVIWVNEKEIPNNGIDDDKNGYIDDVHGWSFIGGKEGNVEFDTYEVTREYARLQHKFPEGAKVSKKQKAEYAYWLKVKKKYDNDFNHNKSQYEQYQNILANYENAYTQIVKSDSILAVRYDKPFNQPTLKNIESDNDTVQFAKQLLLQIFTNIGADDDLTTDELIEEIEISIVQLNDAVDHFGTAVNYGYNLTYDPRSIVGDDQNNVYEKYYGNNDVKGTDARHGTHVAGIIAADRTNTIGMKGVADNVKIMAVRAVPNGDERDKDIANAIIYAVDNGAQIINMSFGKSFSPNKKAVDKAVRYAKSKGVLLVHAAGNDSKDTDVNHNFPTRKQYKNYRGTEIPKKSKKKTNGIWLEIGASTAYNDEQLPASFSNYGKKSVDVFAPGLEIYSTVPDNKYENLQGTSMASPAAAGVAALLMSYFPELSAKQVKEIIMKSSRKYDLKVNQPGSDNKVSFKNLSITGGVVDAYEAVKMAVEIAKK
jgi:cell wall-associated protease